MSQEQETTKAARSEAPTASTATTPVGSGANFDSLGAALIRTSEQPWIDMGGGNQAIVLRVSKETGFYQPADQGAGRTGQQAAHAYRRR